MSTALTRLQPAPDLVDRVFRVLLDAISDGTLTPGERMTQEEIAEQLAVSRQPVLQALRLLKKDGFVVDAPGRGVRVAPLDAEWIGKVYQVRGALDALAARLAAGNRTQLDPALLAAGRDAAHAGDIKALIDADMAFHNAIYAASQNPLIEQSAHLHWRHLRRVMGEVLQSAGQRHALWDEHEAIARAIAAGDEETAARYCVDHVTNASERVALRLEAMKAAARL